MTKRRKSLFERWENHAIYNVKSPRKKRKPIPAASQVSTLDYVGGLLQAKWNRLRTAR